MCPFARGQARRGGRVVRDHVAPIDDRDALRQPIGRGCYCRQSRVLERTIELDLWPRCGQLAYLVGGDEDLAPLAKQVNSEVRKQYILGFSPSGRGDLKYRVVFVSVVKKGNWMVRTRRGYRGTAPAATASR
mgnify:CR=1 FL=1